MANTTNRLEECLLDLRAGHTSARETLIEHSLERLRHLVRRRFPRNDRLHAIDETDDVLNKAVIKLYRTLSEVRPESLRGYFALAAKQIRWVLADLARCTQTARLAYMKDVPDAASPDDSPAQMLEWSEFHCAVEELPESEREIFDLLIYQGLEQAEAAQLMGIPLRTFKRRWREARLRLSDKFHGEMPGERP